MSLHISEDDVARLLTPADAVATIEACFERMARGAVENKPRYRLGLERGAMAVMAAADLELGFAGAKVYVGFAAGARFEVLLFRANEPELVAVIDADKLGQLRTGAASGVAAKHLARTGAATLGVIGCGWQAEMQVECIRAALPSIERTIAYCRTREHRRGRSVADIFTDRYVTNRLTHDQQARLLERPDLIHVLGEHDVAAAREVFRTP